MLTRLYQLELLGDDIQPPYDLQTKFNQLEACGRYRLTFESNISWQMGDDETIEADVKGSIIFHMDQQYMNIFTIYKSGILTYDSFTVEFTGDMAPLNNACTIEKTDSSGTLKGMMRIGYFNSSTDKYEVNPLISIKPSDMNQNTPKWTCSTGAGPISINESVFANELPLWQTGFYDLHKDRLKGDFNAGDISFSNGYWFANFTLGDGVYHIGTLKLHSTTTSSGATAEEDLTLDLQGAPGAQ